MGKGIQGNSDSAGVQSECDVFRMKKAPGIFAPQSFFFLGEFVAVGPLLTDATEWRLADFRPPNSSSAVAATRQRPEQ
jgi:hypothetical protein